MIESNRIISLQEIVDYRREFLRRFEGPPSTQMTDVDYVLARYLIKRLQIAQLTTDGSKEAAALVDSLQPPLAAPQGSVTGFHIGQIGTEIPDSSALVMLTGFAGEVSPASLQSVCSATARMVDAVVFIPRATVFALWRSTSLLLVQPGHRTALLQALADFDTVLGDFEFDILKLSDENAHMRAEVQRLNTPGTNQGEQERLKGVIKTLEAELTALRRAILRQEQTIESLSNRTANHS